MDLIKLGIITKEIFLNQDDFMMKKVITDFECNGKFLGDFFSYLIRENVENESPIFYSIISPFDAIGKTEAYSASIYRDGEIQYSCNFKEYTGIRTGLFTPLVASGLTKKIGKCLIVGSGKLATNGIKSLIEYFPDLTEIYYTNSSGKKIEFEKQFRDSKITISYIEAPNYIEYDYIAFYTNAKECILKKASEIKDGAIISSHISSTNYAEYSDEVYADGNVIIDWIDNLGNMKDIKRALQAGYIEEANIISYSELLKGGDLLRSKRYTLIRTTGTPMQNIAVLKYLNV